MTVSIIHGNIGHVSDFHGIIDAQLRKVDSNWEDLATRLGVSRQYITRVLRSDRIPRELAERVCDLLELPFAQLVTPDELVRSIVVPAGTATDVDEQASAHFTF